jgi:hypothetical protein
VLENLHPLRRCAYSSNFPITAFLKPGLKKAGFFYVSGFRVYYLPLTFRIFYTILMGPERGFPMKFTIIYFVIIISASAFAQKMPERGVTFNPLFNKEKDAGGNEISWINSIGGWGEFGNYLSDKNKDHEWYQKLGLFMEFFRIADSKSLSVLSNIEFIADPNNDINFNPRGIFWEEALLYTWRAEDNFWQAGYYHRCKHDIDNLDYATERSLIYGSLHGKYIYALSSNGYLSLTGDLYTILQDYRNPESSESPVTEELAASIRLNAFWIKPLTGLLKLSLSGYAQLNTYSGSSGFLKKIVKPGYVKLDGGVEAGLWISGNADFGLVIRYEYLSDDGISILPTSSNLVSVGFSLKPWEIR